MYFNTHFESKLDNSPYGTQQHFHRQKLNKKHLTFSLNVVYCQKISTTYSRRNLMRLDIQEFRHTGIQFSLIVLLTMVYFLLIKLVT